MDEDQICEIIPDGFDWGTLILSIMTLLAMFSWDTEKSSKKLNIDED